MRTLTIILALLTALSLCTRSIAAAPTSEERMPPDAGEGRCLDCHGELLEGAVVHAAAELCDVCHVAATAGHSFAVASPVVLACVECHEDPREAAGHVHGPAAAGECTACHDPHRSEEASLLRLASPDLCWSCHGTVQDRPDIETPVRNVRREIAEAATVHGAIEGGCDACHPAHSSARASLFIDSFPDGPYAAGHTGSYELCFACHDEEILEEDPGATEFRDGEQNLHFVHVAQPKSRSCALCHSPHGGGDHLLRDSVRFGSWNMPLVFEATTEGGNCVAACHEPRAYWRPSEPPPGEVEP